MEAQDTPGIWDLSPAVQAPFEVWKPTNSIPCLGCSSSVIPSLLEELELQAGTPQQHNLFH